MCRVLLNAILFVYAGVVVPLGETEGGKEEYLGVVVRAAEGESRDEEGERKKAWAELSSLLLLEGCGRVGGLRDWLGAVA